MRLLGGELLKLTRRPATYITLGIFLAILLVLFLMVGASYNTLKALPAEQGGGPQSTAAIESLLRFPGAYAGIVSFLASLGGLFAAAYGAAAAGADWSWGMVKVAVARGESRSRYILAKLAAVLVLLIPAVVVAFLVGVLGVAAGAMLAGFGLSGMGDPSAVGALPWQLVRAWLALGEQAAIGFAVATLARSQLAGLGASIGIYFVEQFAGAFWPEFVRYLPFSVADSMLRSPSSGTLGAEIGRFTVDPTLALLLVLGYMLAAAIVSAVVLERAEITG